MNASIETADRSLFRGSGEAGETAEHTGQEVRAGREGDVVRAVKHRQDRRRRTAESAVAGNVVGERRRPDKGTPRRIRFSRRVAVGGAIANRSHGPPEVEE